MKRETQLKNWSLAKCKDKAATALQKLRRLEEADQHGFCTCVSCGVRKPWKEMQGGHFVGGRTNAVLLAGDREGRIPHNIHPQCERCNKWANSSDAATTYGLYMADRYGVERVKELALLRHTKEDFTKDELLDMRDEYLDRIKVELKRIDNVLPRQKRNST